MLSLFVYNKEHQKARDLSEKCSEYIKITGRQTEKNEFFSDCSALNSLISSFNGTSVFFLRKDLNLIQNAAHIHSVNPSSYVVMVFGNVDEITDSVTPSFRPSGILPEDAGREKVGRIIEQVYADYERSDNLKDGPVCRFSIRGADYSIPFCQIMVIEVSAKKITLHTAAQRYEFYETLENVMKDMPDCFMRVHRSFVVNKNYISKVNYSEKTLIMNDGSSVFFSRRCGAEVKEYVTSTIKENLF